MNTASTLEPSEFTDNVGERLDRLDSEIAELRHTISDLAEIVVTDIKDRREAASAMATPLPDLTIPESLVPGGKTTVEAVKALRRPWLVVEVLREIGAAIAMYMHPRYRVRRSTQFMTGLLLGLFVANYVFFNVLLVPIPFLTPVLERLLDIVLAVFLYKVLSREVVRYRQAMTQLAVTARASNAGPVSYIINSPDDAPVTRQESP
jgi:hypothetical protein